MILLQKRVDVSISPVYNYFSRGEHTHRLTGEYIMNNNLISAERKALDTVLGAATLETMAFAVLSLSATQTELVQSGISAAHNYDDEQDCGLVEAGLFTEHGASGHFAVTKLVEVACHLGSVTPHGLHNDLMRELDERAFHALNNVG